MLGGDSLFRRIPRIAGRIAAGGPAVARALYAAWRNPPVYPREIQIEHTRRCNLKCVMCRQTHEPLPAVPDMPIEMFQGILDQFHGPQAPEGFRRLDTVALHGLGEPMMHRHFAEMIRYAAHYGLYTSAVSNLTLLTDNLAEELVEIGMSRLIVSIDAIDPEVFADIRRGVSFDILERVLGNLERLRRAKEKYGAEHPRIIVNSLLMKRTLSDIPKLVVRLRELGVSRVSFNDLCVGGLAEETRLSDQSLLKDQPLWDMPRSEHARIMAGIKALSTPECEVTVPGDWGGGTLDRPWRLVLTCEDLWEKPYVTAEGIVTPCCYVSEPYRLAMGNLNHQTFAEIWFSPEYQLLRRQHLTTRYPPDCHACPQLAKTVVSNPILPAGKRLCYPPRNEVFLGDRPRALRCAHGRDKRS